MLAFPPEADVSDRSLVAYASTRLAVPRIDVPPDLFSFVLHAPMELLARAALLPYVSNAARDAALARIRSLVDTYEHVPPQPEARAAEFPSVADACRALQASLQSRDPIGADAAAAFLDAHASTTDIARGLAEQALPALGAAGHANIYVGLVAGTSRAGNLNPMLRPIAAALVSDPIEPLRLPTTLEEDTSENRLVELLAALDGRGDPLSFIAPLVTTAINRGDLGSLCTGNGALAAPAGPPASLLRVAALAMLQRPPDYAAYGWTHCLTLAQGALRAGKWAGDPIGGTYVAAAYTAAHLATYAGGPIDLDYRPQPVRLSIADALHDSPSSAAAAAWDSPEEAVTALATRAAAAHDAHRVKYTLACLEAAADDPAATRLYLAAAAHLNAWWEAQPGS